MIARNYIQQRRVILLECNWVKTDTSNARTDACFEDTAGETYSPIVVTNLLEAHKLFLAPPPPLLDPPWWQLRSRRKPFLRGIQNRAGYGQSARRLLRIPGRREPEFEGASGTVEKRPASPGAPVICKGGNQ